MDTITNTDQHIRPDGAFTYWTPAPLIARDDLRQALATVALEPFTPPQRRPSAVLRDALEAVAWRRRAGLLVRPLAGGNGWEIVAEGQRAEENEYQHRSFARIDRHEQITTDLDQLEAAALASWYTRHRDHADGDQITAMLVATIGALQGLTVKRGFYWVPAHHLDTWRRLRDALQAAGAARIAIARHAFDPDSLEAVQTALAEEVTTQAGRLLTEIAGESLAAKALETRRRAACDLAAKVARYEAILATTLPQLHAACSEAETAAAAAQLELAARDGDQQTGDLFGQVA